ncbi:MAG TPA: Zn-dependent alcohol dehydrogenase [Acidimicrobiales bacterium]|nr:Zn-dependent alcohol dehydrogenase [Acidimicrobiales bacterium]
MKAAVLPEVGAPLEIADVELAPPGPHQVEVRVAASGVCHSDLSMQNGGIPYPLPAVLGHEGSGVVEAIGSAVTRVQPGDHVVLSWIPPCRACPRCLGGQPVLCERGLTDALSAPYATWAGRPLLAAMGTATFAERALVLERSVVPIDPSLSLEVAALVGCAVTTGVGAVINTARVSPGSTVAVVGCGGVGLSVVQGAAVAGAASIVAVDRVSDKLVLASGMGATEVVDASENDAIDVVRELTGGRGVDFAFEVVGSSPTIKQAFGMTRRGGTTILVGAGRPDDIVSFTAMELFVDAKSILGCVYGSADPDRDFPRLLELDRAGRLHLDRLISRRIALDEVNDAFRAMDAGEVARSVIVFGES